MLFRQNLGEIVQKILEKENLRPPEVTIEYSSIESSTCSIIKEENM